MKAPWRNVFFLAALAVLALVAMPLLSRRSGWIPGIHRQAG